MIKVITCYLSRNYDTPSLEEYLNMINDSKYTIMNVLPVYEGNGNSYYTVIYNDNK